MTTTSGDRDARAPGRRTAVTGLWVAVVSSVLLTSCTADSAAGSDPLGSSVAGADQCVSYASYQGASGTTVTMLTSEGAFDAEAFRASVSDFEGCTGIRIVLELSGDEDALSARMLSGTAPDLAEIDQPAMARSVRETRGGADRPVPVPPAAAANVARWWNPAWKTYSTVDGVVYGVPFGANVKSLVWYSPKRFKASGYAVPTTWHQLMDLSRTIARNGQTPWCGGLDSGDATGWPATDWLEQIVLGQYGGEVYDSWVAHTITFQSPQIRRAMRTLDSWMRNPHWVNGGFGDVRSIATTAFWEAGAPILDGKCAMLQQASFYEAQWPDFQEGLEIGPDGDVFAFYLPSPDRTKPLRIVGGIGFVVAFSSRPEVADVLTYLSTPEWNTKRAEQGGGLSANRGVPLDTYTDPIDRLSADYLTRPDVTFRFDASDLMPPAVGRGEEWKQLTLWFSEGQNTDEVLKAIDEAWPKAS